MAAKKKAPVRKRSSPRRDAGVRGLPLVEAAIAARKQGPGTFRPLSDAEIAALRLAGGLPLPPSLAAYLAFDRTGAGYFLETNDALEEKPLSSRELVAWRYPELVDLLDMDGVAAALPGACHRFSYDEQIAFMYVGEPDEHGEYPMYMLQDYDDVVEIVLVAPGFDVFLAMASGVVPSPSYHGGLIDDAGYAPDMRAAARRCSGGKLRVPVMRPWDE